METRLRAGIELSKTLEDRTARTPHLATELYCPFQVKSRDDFQVEMSKSFFHGGNMILVERYLLELAGTRAANLAFPMTFTPKGGMPYVDWLVTIGDPDDAARILREHTKKSVLYGIAFLGDGVLATPDNQLWTEQRKHLVEAFMPEGSLGKEVFPVSLQRAKYAADVRMAQLAAKPDEPFNLNEFLLFEAMAQLQLALLGESEEVMEQTNKPLRESFERALTPQLDIQEALKTRTRARREIIAGSEALLARKPQGPLGRRLADNCPMGKDLPRVRRDSVSTIHFAGHDTTANLMTWTIYELCRHPSVLTRVRAEIDAVSEELIASGREMAWSDLAKFKFLTRVIAETLRLWPSVPNGTFRELEHDDVVKGRNGSRVTLPQGTQVNIPAWLVHMNTELWGPDADEFNPDREFLPEELWNDAGFASWNPQSRRYMPFTGSPRDCIGKTFAHMEARVILINLLRKYDFALAEPTLSVSLQKGGRVRDPKAFIASNNGTMSPKGGLWVTARPRRR